MAETRVTVTGVDNGVSSMMQKLRQNAQSTAQQMIQDARTQSKSARDQIDLINQQIRALEKKNKITQQARQQQIEAQRASGEITQGDARKQLTQVKQSSQEDKMQVDLLRELIDTTKMVAKQEFVADEKRVERELDSSRRYRKSDNVKDDDILNVFKQDIQEDMIKDDDPQRGSNLNQIGPLLQQRNEVYALASLSKMIPMVGGTLNSLYQKALSQAEQTEASRGRVQSLSFGQVGFEGGDMASFGYTISQYMGQFLEPTMRAMSTTNNPSTIRYVAEEVLQAEKGYGIDKSITLERQRLLRGTTEQFQFPDSMITQTIGSLFRSGVIDGSENQNFAILSDFMQLQNQLTSTQIQKFSDVDQNTNANILARFAGLGGTFENPQVLGNIVRNVDSSLSQPSTPFAQAMQFSALSKIKPNASRFELMEMQEKGLQQPGLMKEMFNMISNASGGNSDLMMEQVKAMMPQLSFSQVRRMVSSFQEGNLDLDFDQEFMTTGLPNLKQRAKKATGLMEARSAGLDNVFATEGERMAQELSRFNTGMDLIKGTIETILGTSTDVVEQIANLSSWFMGGGFETSTKKANTNNNQEQPRTNKIKGK